MQIGVGLQMYEQAQGFYPSIASPGGPAGDGPIKAMLDSLLIPDLLELRDPTKPPKRTQAPPKRTRVPGLACPSDPNAVAGHFASVVSYRACTGDDPGGHGGVFEPGRRLSNVEVEAADGLSFTAAFAERLLGNGQDRRLTLENYANCPGPVIDGGCPVVPPESWQGDAGSDWAEADWRSTLYNHALVPNAARSCIALDGRSALMGASSAHPNRINVLLMDGSLRGVTPTIDPMVWRALGTVGTVASPTK